MRTHGSNNMYVNGRCRCQPCRDAHTVYNDAWRSSEWRTARQAERRAQVDEFKLREGCARCGYAEHPHALHFHHRDGADKEASVSRLISREGSDKRLWAEIAKCDVICANCHAVLHAELAGWIKRKDIPKGYLKNFVARHA